MVGGKEALFLILMVHSRAWRGAAETRPLSCLIWGESLYSEPRCPHLSNWLSSRDADMESQAGGV